MLIVEHQLEVVEKKERQKQLFAIGAWVALCLTLFFTASTLFRQTKVDRLTAEREVEFYLANIEGYPAVSSATAREAVTTALQSYEDHFGIRIKNWKFIEEKIPEDIEAYMNQLPKEKLSDLSSWQQLYRNKLMPDWYQRPYQPLRVFITNFPLRAPDFLRMETRHLSASRLVGGFANPAFIIISSYRMLTELKESETANQSRYMGEFLIAHELGHALLGLPDFVAPPEFQEFNARGLASAAESPYSKCLMHTDEGGGLNAWRALKARPLGQSALCFSYEELLRAHDLRREAIGLAKAGNFDEALKQMDIALTLLPSDNRALAWLKDLWTDERRTLARY